MEHVVIFDALIPTLTWTSFPAYFSMSAMRAGVVDLPKAMTLGAVGWARRAVRVARPIPVEAPGNEDSVVWE